MEDVRNMKAKVQDTVRGLQDLTEEERKDVLSCLTKCLLIKDEELQDLEQRVRGPRKHWGGERKDPMGRAVDTLPTICSSGTRSQLPTVLALGV